MKFLKNIRLQMVAIDAVILFLTACMAYFVSNAISFVSFSAKSVFIETFLFIALTMICLYLFKVYRNIWKYARIIEFADCIAAVTAGTALYYGITQLFLGRVCNIYSLFLYMFSAFGITFSRCLYSYLHILILKRDIRNKESTLIIGGGDACREIIIEMLQSASCGYKPVVIVDDNPEKKGKRINSVPIEGSTGDIPKLVEKYSIKYIIFAIPSCDPKNRKRIMSICAETGCEIKIIPFLHELFEVNNLLGQMKPIKIEDLLGRDVIKLDNPMLSETISGKVCMVTGGGGSIGSELSRQIAKHNPKKLVIVDIYENNAYDIQQELVRTYGDKLDLQVQIASVRDYDKMEHLFKEYRPQLVFHAAAHKHVPLMETNPEEAIKNNVFGTLNTALLAEKYKVEKFVLVSTDKAVNPTNVMGATKRCCEMIVQCMAQRKPATEFIAVRFGNVLGSNGSVIPLFERQIAENRPLTVTHPDIIRYFMTIPEAVSLILEAATIARGGEIFVLDMGEPVKILTLAENLIRMHGKEPYTDINIVFTGLRPGEKLYEELLMDEEGLRSTAHNRIFVGRQISVNSKEFGEQLKKLKEYAEGNNAEACVDKLSEIVPTFVHEKKKTATS